MTDENLDFNQFTTAESIKNLLSSCFRNNSFNFKKVTYNHKSHTYPLSPTKKTKKLSPAIATLKPNSALQRLINIKNTPTR